MRGMEDIIIAVVGVLFLALVAWLNIRIAKQRQRWVIWTSVLWIEALGLFVSGYLFCAYFTFLVGRALPRHEPTRIAALGLTIGTLAILGAFALGALLALIIYLRPQRPAH